MILNDKSYRLINPPVDNFLCRGFWGQASVQPLPLSLAEARIHRFPPGKPVFGGRPEADLLLAQLPAQQHGLAVNHAGKIEQPILQRSEEHTSELQSLR